MVPMLVLPPVTPLTRQVTALLEVLVTVAAKACVPPVCTLAVAGLTETPIGAGGGAGDDDGGCVVVAALGPPEPPPHPASCSDPPTSHPVTSHAITRRFPGFVI
jgi:hypothetical protein